MTYPFTLGFAAGTLFGILVAIGAVLLLTRGPGAPDWTGFEDD